MRLLTEAIIKKFPKLYANEGKNLADVPVILKIFNPRGAGTWFLTEFDGDDIFFGLCCIQCPELGYVSLTELKSIGYLERDLYYRGSLQDAMTSEGL